MYKKYIYIYVYIYIYMGVLSKIWTRFGTWCCRYVLPFQEESKRAPSCDKPAYISNIHVLRLVLKEHHVQNGVCGMLYRLSTEIRKQQHTKSGRGVSVSLFSGMGTS